MKCFFVLIFLFLGLILNAHAASFDCTKAGTSIERLICADPRLSDIDSAESALYFEALSLAPSPDMLRSEQREWLVKTRNRASSADDLLTAYKIRQQALRDHIGRFRAASIPPAKTTIPPTAVDPTTPIDFQEVNEGLLRAKLAGKEPNYPALTDTIVSKEEREYKIADLKRQYAAIDLTALYRVRISGATFTTNTLTKHMVSTLNERSYLPVGAASEAMSRRTGGGMSGALLAFDNIIELSDVNLGKLPSSNNGVARLLASNRTLRAPMDVSFYLKISPNVVVLTSMPTVMGPVKRDVSTANEVILIGHMIGATLFKGTPDEITLSFPGMKPTMPVPPADTKAASRSYSDQLARNGRSKDFDVHGVNLSQSFDEVKAWAAREGLEIRQDQFMAGLKATQTVFGKPESCRYYRDALSFTPFANGDACIRVIHDGQILIQVKYEFQTDDAKAEIEKAVLEKYGMPYEYDGQDTYFWGADGRSAYTNLSAKRVFYITISEFPRNVRNVVVCVVSTEAAPPGSKPKL